jgi:hypothetical protein
VARRAGRVFRLDDVGVVFFVGQFDRVIHRSVPNCCVVFLFMI